MLDVRRGDGALVRVGLGKAVVFLNSWNIRWAPPPLLPLPRRSTAQSVPDVSWEQSRTGTPQLEIRQQFIASYGPGLVCLLHTHTHQHTTFLSFREHVNTRLSIFSSVQEIWSEQVAACKLKCGAPRSPPVLQHMIDSLLLFSFLSLPLPPVFSFLSLYRSSELRLWDLDYGSS